MNITNLLTRIFEEMTFHSRVDITDDIYKINIGQAVFSSDDFGVIHFPIDGERKPMEAWLGDSDGLTLSLTHDCIVEGLKCGPLCSTESYLSERKVVELLVDFAKIISKKIEEGNVDPVFLRSQFDELWRSHSVRCLPDPADFRTAIKEKNEQSRTNKEGVGTC